MFDRTTCVTGTDVRTSPAHIEVELKQKLNPLIYCFKWFFRSKCWNSRAVQMWEWTWDGERAFREQTRRFLTGSTTCSETPPALWWLVVHVSADELWDLWLDWWPHTSHLSQVLTFIRTDSHMVRKSSRPLPHTQCSGMTHPAALGFVTRYKIHLQELYDTWRDKWSPKMVWGGGASDLCSQDEKHQVSNERAADSFVLSQCEAGEQTGDTGTCYRNISVGEACFSVWTQTLQLHISVHWTDPYRSNLHQSLNTL